MRLVTLAVALAVLVFTMGSSAGGNPSPVVEEKFEAWRVVCQSGSCSAYQYGRGGSRPTILRIEPGVETAPRMRIEGGPFTPSGEVRFSIDGEWSSGGMASILGAGSGGDLILEPDDITDGLARQMKVGKILELTVPRGQDSEIIEFGLEGFAEALQRVIGD